MSIKIKKDDIVKVIAGKNKGKEGKVLKVLAKENRVIVEGVNMISKHMKPSAANQNGGIVKQEAPIHISNVMYVHNGKAVRLGYEIVDGKKVRVAKVGAGKTEAIR